MEGEGIGNIKVGRFEEEVSEPLSPSGQYLSTSVFSLTIFAVWELERPIDDPQALLLLLKNTFLPVNPRFSSIMVTDEKGVKHWKRVEVDVEKHARIPVFPAGMAPSFYDQCFENYMSEISIEPFPLSRPLWEIHMIKYPTSAAAGTLIFKLHHALGDGFSLIATLLSCLRRADDPSRPLTFPSMDPNRNSSKKNTSSKLRAVPKVLSFVVNSVSDFWGVIKATLVKDDPTPIRGGSSCIGDGPWGFKPITVSTAAFSLDDIKRIKASLGVTINDVVTGVVFLGTRLYMAQQRRDSSRACCNAVILLNTRMLRTYKSVQEMLKTNADTPWGNHFAYLQIPLPNLPEANALDPLEFVRETHKVINRKRASGAVYLTGQLLEFLRKFMGPEAAAKFLQCPMKNTSMGISNMMGPVEKVALADQPIKGMYFAVSGAPQSLSVPVLSYMGKLRIAVVGAKGFIDVPKLISCIENAFDMVLKAANQVVDQQTDPNK